MQSKFKIRTAITGTVTVTLDAGGGRSDAHASQRRGTDRNTYGVPIHSKFTTRTAITETVIAFLDRGRGNTYGVPMQSKFTTRPR